MTEREPTPGAFDRFAQPDERDAECARCHRRVPAWYTSKNGDGELCGDCDIDVEAALALADAVLGGGPGEIGGEGS